jgi:hypothetical protein
MDALKMALVDLADAAHESDAADVQERREVNLAPRMRRALAALAEAHEYARDLDADPWDFAVEIASLQRQKLSNSDLRWLTVRGLVEHAIEVTPLGESQRSFRRPARLMFGKRTCFVLARGGGELVQAPCECVADERDDDSRMTAQARAFGVLSTNGSLVPKWDRDRQELSVGSTVVKQFKIPSRSQAAVLAAFEEKSWPPRIDDPFAARGEPAFEPSLKRAIELLNERQRPPLIRFRADAADNGILWELRLDHPASCEA